MKTRILAIVLSLSFLLLMGASSEKAATIETALNDTSDFLCQMESMLQYALWTFSYVDKYNSSRDWKDLQIARAVLMIARQHLEKLEIESAAFSQQDALELVGQGVDFAHVPGFKKVLEDSKTEMLSTYLDLRNGLEEDAFLEPKWVNRMRMMKISRKLVNLDIQYYAALVDYTISQTGDPELEQAFRKKIQENCAGIGALVSETRIDREEAEKKATEILDQIDKATGELFEAGGYMQATENEIADQIKSENLDWFRNHRATINGLPPVIPYPFWYDSEKDEYECGWLYGSVEALPLPEPGDAVETAPTWCMISGNGIKKEDAILYWQELQNLGYLEKKTGESAVWDVSDEFEDQWNAHYSTEEGEFFIDWNAGRLDVVIDRYPLCFATYEYLLEMLDAS